MLGCQVSVVRGYSSRSRVSNVGVLGLMVKGQGVNVGV